MKLNIDVDRVSRSDVVALLEPGPQAVGALAEWLNQPRATVRAALIAMSRDALVVQVGETWALVAVAPPVRKPRYPKRQADQKPRLTPPVPVTHTSTSWWLDLDRQAFMATATREQPRMRLSTIGRRSTLLTVNE